MSYGDGKVDRNVAWNWESEDQMLTWPAYLSEPATFEVAAEYTPEQNTGTIRVSVDDVALTAETEVDDKGFREQTLGRLNLPAGPVLVDIRPAKPPVGGLMRLRALSLRPVAEE